MDHSNHLSHRLMTVRDPIPEAIADSLWLGGEAMIAPMNLRWDSRRPPSQPCMLASAASHPARLAATERDADPSWLVI